MDENNQFVIPTYNEKENVRDGYERVTKIMQHFPDCDYEILFIDNASTDGTRDILRVLAMEDMHVKVILNAVMQGGADHLIMPKLFMKVYKNYAKAFYCCIL